MQLIERIYQNRRGDKPAHFFDADTMRYFDSALDPAERIWHQRRNQRLIFVTSEQFHGSQGSGPRRFTVRVMDHTGHVRTVGPHCEFTESEAVAVAEDLAERRPYPGWALDGAKDWDYSAEGVAS